MKKHAAAPRGDDALEIPPLGAEFFAKAQMGRYYAKMMAKSNVVRIAPDLCEAFPNEAAVNQALREVLRFREALTEIVPSKLKQKKTA